MIRRSRRHIPKLLVALALVGLALLASCGDKIPPNVLLAMKNADRFEVLSLDPDFYDDQLKEVLEREELAEGNEDDQTTNTEIPVRSQFEPASPEPDHRLEETAPEFHGWRVIGRTEVKDSKTQQKLVSSLKRGTRWGWICNCGFRPHHGIRVTYQGRTICILIRFHSFRAVCYEGGIKAGEFSTSRKSQDAFDQVLSAAGVPLAEKPSK